MAVKRGGLGRGLDLLIPSSPSARKNVSRETSEQDENRNDKSVDNVSRETSDIVSSGRKSTKDKKVSRETSEVIENSGKTESSEDVSRETSPASEKDNAGNAAPASSGTVFLKISDVEPNREQPRKHFDEDTLQELADSIRSHGVIQPLLVQKKGDYYEIIAGERRWRAAKIAGLKEIPVVIKEFSDQEAVEISLIENVQRQDLNPIEEANAYRRLMEEYHLKQDETAQRVGKSRATVTNSLRLLKLDERVQQMLIDEMITTGHARPLLAVEDHDAQFELANKIFDEKLSVREVEKLVRQYLKPAPQKPQKEEDASLDVIYSDMEEKMKASLGTKVVIQRKSADKGKIEIEYYSRDELERLYDFLRSQQ